MNVKDFIRLVSFPFFKFYFYVKPIKISVNSLDKTLDKLIKSDKSIIRFGDGELKLISGKSICFQSYTDILAKELDNVIRQNEENLLIALPDIFNKNNLTFQAKLFWNFDLFLKQKYYRRIPSRLYENAFLSRPYMDYADKENKISFFIKMKSLWEDRKIVFIEGDATRNGVNNDLYANAKSIKRIICPSQNSYSIKDKIIDYVKENIDKDSLICLSLGPAAKIIGYELYKMGYRILDLGHLDSEYEWCLCKAKKKIRIEGKHTAEHNDDNLNACTDENYLSQILVSFV